MCGVKLLKVLPVIKITSRFTALTQLLSAPINAVMGSGENMRISSFILVSALSVSALAAKDSSELCGQVFRNTIEFSRSIKPRHVNDTLSLVNWNAHKYKDKQYFWDLKALSADADVLMIQEAIHSTGWENAFAGHMPFSFSFFKSFCTDDQATGVQNAARYPLMNNKNLVSRDTEPVTFTPKATGISHIDVAGYGSVTLANIHALNFNTGSDFERQIDQVAAYLATEKGRIIWAGDFNTWAPSRKEYLLKKTKALGLTHVQLKNDKRRLVLDHIFVRGFDVVRAEVLDFESSDHKPLKAVLRFKK